MSDILFICLHWHTALVFEENKNPFLQTRISLVVFFENIKPSECPDDGKHSAMKIVV